MDSVAGGWNPVCGAVCEKWKNYNRWQNDRYLPPSTVELSRWPISKSGVLSEQVNQLKYTIDKASDRALTIDSVPLMGRCGTYGIISDGEKKGHREEQQKSGQQE